MSTIILDLDYTLLNTTAFKLALAKSLDLSAHDWEQAYNGFVADNGLFKPEDLLKGVTAEQRQAFAEVVQSIRRYLYPDTLAFLQSAQAAGHQLTIVTFGQPAWQEQKLQALRLPSDVECRATEGSKVTVLADLVNDDTIVVDDRAVELEQIVKAYPVVKAYWMTRPDGKYVEPIPQCPHQQINSLNQIKL